VALDWTDMFVTSDTGSTGVRAPVHSWEVVDRLIVALDGRHRRIVVLGGPRSYLACCGDSAVGLVVWVASGDWSVRRLLGPAGPPGRTLRIVTNGRTRLYDWRFVVDLDDARRAAHHYFKTGAPDPELTWVEQ
jgi:hypothetical protein